MTVTWIIVLGMAITTATGGFFVARDQSTSIGARISAFLFGVCALSYGFTQGKLLDKQGLMVFVVIACAAIIGGVIGAITDKADSAQ